MRAASRLVVTILLVMSGAIARGEPPGGDGTIFGERIEARKLGVMIDVSGSTHPFLSDVLTEVDRSFKGMPTVLVFGCGAKESIKSSDFEIQAAPQAQNEYEAHVMLLTGDLTQAEKRRVEESVFGQVAKACTNPKLQALEQSMNRILKQPNVYWSIASKEVNPRFGSALAMEFLIEQGVDTIYWFSDCNDEFAMGSALEISEKLKAKNVRMIAHNFSGIDDPKLNRGVVAAIKITEETGGQYISKKIPAK